MESFIKVRMSLLETDEYDFVVVYHVTNVAIEHGLLEKFWPIITDCVLRTAGTFLYLKPGRPVYFPRTNQLLPRPGLAVNILNGLHRHKIIILMFRAYYFTTYV